MRQYNRRKPGDHLPYVGIGILLWFPERSSPRLRFLITFLFFFYTFISILLFFVFFVGVFWVFFGGFKEGTLRVFKLS